MFVVSERRVNSSERSSASVCAPQEMFDASLKDRELSFKSAPGTTMFLHWLVGMVYVFYFASFILLLREVGSRNPSTCVVFVSNSD